MILRKAHYQFDDKYRRRSRERDGEKTFFEERQYYCDNHPNECGIYACRRVEHGGKDHCSKYAVGKIFEQRAEKSALDFFAYEHQGKHPAKICDERHQKYFPHYVKDCHFHCLLRCELYFRRGRYFACFRGNY